MAKDAKYDRNQVKRVLLAERITTEQAAVVQRVDSKEEK
jgi:hypothetical protein